jgi:hypothetical protein
MLVAKIATIARKHAVKRAILIKSLRKELEDPEMKRQKRQ